MLTVLLIATLETKSEECTFLSACIRSTGIKIEVIDISLGAKGENWSGEKKAAQVTKIIHEKSDEILYKHLNNIGVVVALGGGTGGDIALRIMEKLPPALPKLLITPMPFDPRPALANNAVTLVPSIVDIAGLNPILRDVLTNVSAMITGLCQQVKNQANDNTSTVGITSLNATGGATDYLITALHKIGYEPAVFHANGFGGATFTKFTTSGTFKAVIDLTCQEITRLLFEGEHVDMPTRFTAAADLPRVVLPGGMNFLSLGPLESLNDKQRHCRMFRHSSGITHISLSPEQMEVATKRLADDLNQSTAPTHVIVPMGGFSFSDSVDGDLEAPQLRQICLDVLKSHAKAYQIKSIPHHINDKATTDHIMATIRPYL